jgi:hypothetical protein
MIVIMLMGVCFLPAQISNYYSFSTTTEAYSAISGTNVPTAIGDNVISNPVDIGFNFVYGLNTYSQIKISSDGYITLGTEPGSTSHNALGSFTCPVLAPLWDDTYLQGSAQYLLEGTAPNRVFTVQFTGVKWPRNSVTSFRYQVKLHEDSTIEFIYGTGVGMPVNASASIGINMLPGGYNNFCSVTPGNPATASYTVENSYINTWPGADTKYVFSAPEQFENDLAALSITGNQTPTAEVSYDYEVAVFNNGTATQTAYSVSIMSADTVLATVAGPAIAPLSTVNVAIPFTPPAAGTMEIIGKVILAADENSSNDSTDPLSLNVQEVGVTVLTIGDGSELARKPIDLSYRNSMFQTIFPASEITVNGTVTSISFYNDFVADCSNIHTKIWLGTTTQTSLANGWIPAYQMVQVFDGNITYPSGQNVVNIACNTTTPFTYSGGNLVMLVSRPMDDDFYSSNNKFFCQTVGSNRSRNAYSDLSTYNPNSMGTVGTVSGQFPKTSFFIESVNVDPVFGVDPQTHNFGQVLINESVSQSFSVYNSGGGILNVSSVSLSGSPFFGIQNLPTLPVALGSGQSMTFSVQYLPTSAGSHTGTINITDDLARLTHTVNLSGNCIDPTITTIPHTQNFDTVTVPNLPRGWRKLTTGTGTVSTVTNAPYSAPNSVLMNNSNSPLGPFLISPPIAAAHPVNELKLKFRAKGASGFAVKVGVMTSPQNSDSFTEIKSINLSSEWAAYSVDLRSYAGTGNYIAFKHSQGGNNRNIYIDNVAIESLLQDDLAALSLTGNTTPNAGTSYNYSVEIYNYGLNDQSDYQVKLYKQGGVEMASAAGPVIVGNTQATVIIPWTPSTTETTFIYARVVLDGDENASNNQSPNLNISVQASETTLVEIGSGNDFTYMMPVNMNALSSLYENIYRYDEINYSGLITIVNFYNMFTSIIPPKHTRIWMGLTDQQELTEGWIPASELSLVFDGDVHYPAGSNTISIQLQEPFTLAPGYNLVMMVQRPQDTVSYTSWESFLCQTSNRARSRTAYSSIELDPNYPPVGSFSGQFPKTGFYITPGTAGSLAGVVYNENNQALANATVAIQNGPQTTTNADGEYSFPIAFASDYAVTASAIGYYDQTQYITVFTDSTSVLDFTLTQRPSVSVSGTIFASDNTSEGLAGASITLSGYGEHQAVTDAAGIFTIDNVYADHSYTYLAEAEGFEPSTGSIDIAAVDYNMGNIILNEITYVPHDVTAAVSDDFASAEIQWQAPDPDREDRALLGYKVWRLQSGEEDDETAWIELTADTITGLSYTDTAWNTLPQGSFKWAVKGIYSSDLISAAAFSNSLQTTGVLTGTVSNQEMEPLAQATITVGTHSATTAADGSYTLRLAAGSYSAVCSLEGYYDISQHDIEIEVGETTELDFTLIPISNTGTLLGVVKNQDSLPVVGATITVDTHTTTTVANGSYVLYLPAGSYDVTCSHEDYFSVTEENVQITVDQTTQLDFDILPVGNEDNLMVAATKLNGNYPNPFNPSTTISYDIKDAAEVFLAIYNVKGQLIRSLVHEAKSPGHHTVEWDGKDQNGNIVGSGIYQYVMKAGKYQETRRMTLIK